MLWYKSWLETRWRFLIGMALLVCSAAGLVLTEPQVMKLIPLARTMELGGALGRDIRKSMELALEYRGYIWSQWFGKNALQMATLFAVLLGTGGMLSEPSGGVLFTLSMPASRRRLLGVRVAAGLAEFLALAFVPSLLIPLLSGAIGQTYHVGAALIHSACLFAGGAVFFSLACLLSTIFFDLWRPLLITLLIAVMLALGSQIFGWLEPYSVFRMMSGETYFRTGALPWLGLLASAAASAGLLYRAAVNIARRDF
jgi:ABC-type transport system involved in multi-copper enzyme maturation permease subunit